jgi:hypothetical protein
MLADFAKRNFLVRPDESEQPDADRIQWILTDHDVKVRQRRRVCAVRGGAC